MSRQTRSPAIHLARVYDRDATGSGARLLVDRLWPRGLSKDKLHLDEWIREAGPTTGLRKWFGHDPEKFAEFRKRFENELDANPEVVARLLAWCRKGPVTLLFAAHDEDHNNAVVLRDYLAARLGDGAGKGKGKDG